MLPTCLTPLSTNLHWHLRWWIWSAITLISLGSFAFLFLVETKIQFLTDPVPVPAQRIIPAKEPFPLSVNPVTKTIAENPTVNDFFHNHVASNFTPPAKNQTWLALLINHLITRDWYQNLASPISRILIIQSGDRAEQIANNFTRTLGWTSSEKATFLSTMKEVIPTLPDGKFYPGKYLLEKDTPPEVAATVIADRFSSEIKDRYTTEIETTVPLDQTLIIASLIEREANDFEDMRYISGVIWNRLFSDMRLQIDATLQYVRGSKPNEPWWPVPVPSDKYLKSPYNTYLNVGLPPAPISNPSIDAIVAALNPHETNCLFYFHDKNGVFHCAATYEEHVALLKQYFGKGK